MFGFGAVSVRVDHSADAVRLHLNLHKGFHWVSRGDRQQSFSVIGLQISSLAQRSFTSCPSFKTCLVLNIGFAHDTGRSVFLAEFKRSVNAVIRGGCVPG